MDEQAARVGSHSREANRFVDLDLFAVLIKGAHHVVGLLGNCGRAPGPPNRVLFLHGSLVRQEEDAAQ